jgi:hypothetical protein
MASQFNTLPPGSGSDGTGVGKGTVRDKLVELLNSGQGGADTPCQSPYQGDPIKPRIKPEAKSEAWCLLTHYADASLSLLSHLC